jgi:DNA polymerase-3 subunit alpha
MSLLDLMGEGDRQKMAVTFPRVTEYERSQLLAMEKEVLSIYISGHPLEDYAGEWKKRATAISTDFKNTASAGDADEAAGYTAGQNGKLFDGQRVLVGGIISEKRIKYTKNNQIMAYITLEDMVGSFEAIVFP